MYKDWHPSFILDIITNEISIDMKNNHIIMMMNSQGDEMHQPCFWRGEMINTRKRPLEV
jgi:hypothetical protein